MKFPRFSLSWLMVAMAAAALTLYVRHERFAARARLHRDEIKKLEDYYCRMPRIPYEYHTVLLEKYERAARYPFLPVAADLQMPKWP
jgi:hypothetical protein